MNQNQIFDYIEDIGVLNRLAIIVRAKQLFLTWLNTIQSEDPLEFKDVNEPNIYLINSKDNGKEASLNKWLKKNYKKIFYNQLFSWHTELADYPQNVDFKMFNEWFDYEFSDSVIEIGKSDFEIY
jgi:hypothetical protein